MTEPGTSLRLRIEAAATRPVDGSSLAAFRILFGLVLAFSSIRYQAAGWIETQLVAPRFHFKYWGLEWVPTAPSAVLHAEFTALAVLGLCIAAGFLHRWSTLAFLAIFLHVRLIDATNYLNHYYLVDLLLVLLAVLPVAGMWSVDAWRRPALRRDTVPAWAVWLVRFQVGLVYCFAAVAKVGPDWLLHGQPLGLWLRTRTDVPVLGILFEQPWAPLAMSWAGFLYDATIVGWLLWKRSRPFAYLVILGFHFVTNTLFDIGIFPLVMPVATTVFFAPHWARRVVERVERVGAAVRGGWSSATRGETAASRPTARRALAAVRAGLALLISEVTLRKREGLRDSGAVAGPSAPLPRLTAALLVLWVAFHVLFPLRFLAYPGNVLWAEEAMRFSWRVMVREKSGSVTYTVTDPTTNRTWDVNPARYLTFRQLREMSTQPDLIAQLARHVARETERELGHPVELRAEALVSLNGRPPALLLDPSVDLARQVDGFAPKTWIVRAPSGPPAPSGLALARPSR